MLRPRFCNGPPDEHRQSQGSETDQREQSTDRDEIWITDQVRGPSLLLGRLRLEEPSHVSVQGATDLVPCAAPVLVGRVRIAFLVGVGVVRRWLATQLITLPSIPNEPATARVILPSERL